MSILEMTDYFIKPSSISPYISNGFKYLLGLLDKKCQVITIPLFHFDSYWPNDIAKERGQNKYYLSKLNNKLPAFVERDQVIERFVDEEMPINKIIEIITDENFFECSEVLKNHENCMKRIRLADRLSNIKISEYISDTYNIEKLFCDRGHFESPLLKEYVKELLIYLDKSDCINELENMDIIDIFARINELPIYPSAARILNLKWVNKETLYRQTKYGRSTLETRLVTFEEYMDSFIRYCYAAKNTLKHCYHDISI